MDTSESRDDQVDVGAEEAAAAREAAAIGGVQPDYGVDPADQAVVEGGGGVAEGFELAEDALIENAQHGEGGFVPGAEGFSGEAETDRSGAAFGEGNELDTTEVVRDPEAGPEDPGEGPKLAAER